MIKKTCFIALLATSSVYAIDPPPQYPSIKPPMDTLSPATSVAKSADWLASLAAQNTITLKDASQGVLPKSYDDNWSGDANIQKGVLGYWEYLKNFNDDYKAYISDPKMDTGHCSEPKPDQPNSATIERTVTHNGLDVYDGAVWSIALAAAAADPATAVDKKQHYRNLLSQYLHTLKISGSLLFKSYRAFEGGDSGNIPYMYNGAKMDLPGSSFLLKFIPPSWGNNQDPIHQCDMAWQVWDSVTGENAWSLLIGPIQTAYLLRDPAQPERWADSEWVKKLAVASIPAFMAMQDPVSGGFFFEMSRLQEWHQSTQFH